LFSLLRLSLGLFFQKLYYNCVDQFITVLQSSKKSHYLLGTRVFSIFLTVIFNLILATTCYSSSSFRTSSPFLNCTTGSYTEPPLSVSMLVCYSEPPYLLPTSNLANKSKLANVCWPHNFQPFLESYYKLILSSFLHNKL